MKAHSLVVGLLAVLTWSLPTHAQPNSGQGIDFFEKKIRPVLIEHCYKCHSAEARKARGGLQLDSAAALRKGGDSGPALVPGQPDKSLLLKALRHDGLKMPSAEKQLPASTVADFEKWIAMGAPDPRQGKTTALNAIDFAEARKFWAFQRPTLHPVPPVQNATWASGEIDAFLLAALEKRALRPVRAAGKRELIRRATFDLIGLPPTAEEVADFERDPNPNAFARVVDRLLASPHYGERWGRFWLDVSRYADDKALAFPTPWPHAFRYRDWVVRAFNDDLRYDEFVRLQLAGDLLPGAAKDGERMQLAALGFQGLGAEYHKGSVPAQVMADELDDRMDTLTRGLLGLTVACARCHDHKYDPIPTRDYYSLASAYNGASWNVVTLSAPAVVARYQAWEKQGKEHEVRIARWSEQQKADIVHTELRSATRYLLAARKLESQEKLNAHFLSRTTAWLEKAQTGSGPLAEWLKIAATAQPGEALQQATTKLQAAITAAVEEQERLDRECIDPTSKPGKLSSQSAALLQVLTKGNTAPFSIASGDLPGLLPPNARKQWDALQAETRRHRESSPPVPEQAHGVSRGGGAMRIAIRGNVERLGAQAPPGFLQILQDRPTARTQFTRLDLADAICSPENPLTARVIVNRVWQHHFGRGLVGTASNFGQLGDRPTHPELLDTLAVRFMETGWSIKWLHRQMMLSSAYRLSSESDSRNQTADPDNAYLWRFTPRRLDVEAWRDAILTVSGRLDRNFGGLPGNLGDPTHARRTLYGKVSRLEPDKMLVAFDFPDANVSSERRSVTVVPQQQLFVLNSEFMLASAKSLAARLNHATSEEERIQSIHRWAFGRAATAAEVQLGLRFLHAGTDIDDRLSVWDLYAQAILASNEFAWID